MSRLFSPSAPSGGLEAWGPGVVRTGVWDLQGQRGVWKGVLLGEEGAGGEAGRLWQVAEEGERGPGSPSARLPGKWESVDLLPLTVVLQGPLHLVPHSEHVGEWCPGSGGGCNASCSVPPATGSGGGGQLVPLNLTGDLVKVQEAPRWCISTQCPGQLVPRPHFEECVHTGEFPQPWQPKPESFRWMPLAESGPVCALPRSAVSTSASPSAS